jgi:hypothetical protein
VLHIETTCKKKTTQNHSVRTTTNTPLLTIARVCVWRLWISSHGRVREPAEAANRSYFHPPSRAGDGAVQTAGTARSAGVATRVAPSVHHQQAAFPALESLPKIPVVISKTGEYLFFATYRAGRSDTSWTARATKDRRTPGGKHACLRMARCARRRRPQNQRCKSGTSHDRLPLVVGPLPRR